MIHKVFDAYQASPAYLGEEGGGREPCSRLSLAYLTLKIKEILAG